MPELESKFGAAVARTVAATAIEGAIGAATQVASNAITQKTIDPTQKLTEGAGTAAATQAAMGGVGRTIHEAAPTILSKLRQNVAEKAAAPQAPAPEAAKPPVMPEAVQAPKTPEKAPVAPPQAVPEAHPARIENIDALTDYYKQHNPNDTTGDLIKSMAPHTPFVKAKVPLDFVQGVGEDVDQAKVAELGKLTAEERQARGPAMFGPNGDIIDGAHRTAAAKEAGDTHIQAYVPEDLIGQHGIEAAGGKIAEAADPQAALLDAHAQVEKLKTANDPQADHAAAQLQSDLDAYGQKHGEDKMEDLIEKMQTPQPKPEQNVRTSEQVQTPEKPHLAETVAGPGSIYHEEVKPQLDKFVAAGKEIKEGLKSLFPVETGAGDENAQQVFREQFNRKANEHYAAQDAFESARKGFDKMHPDDQTDFMRRMYNQDAQTTPELQKISDLMHADTNEGRKELASLGHEAANDWSENHWNMLWKKDAAKAAQMLAVSGNPNRPGKIEGKAGFLKGRTEGDFDAKLAQGLVPKYSNPAEMFLATKAERGKYVAGVRGMEQLVGNDQIMRATDRNSIPKGWEEVPAAAKGPLTNVLATGQHADKLKGDGPLIAPEGVNRILKNIITPSVLGNKAAFRILMDANNTITQSMLGVSGFHIKKVSQELINMNAARSLDMVMREQPGAAKELAKGVVSPFKAVMSGGDIQKMMLGQMKPQTAQQAQVIDAMKTQFKARPDAAYETQWGRKFQKAMDQGGLQGLIRAGVHAAPALNERLMQKGVFGFVQRAKLHMGHEMVTDYLKQNPNALQKDLIAETGKISDHLDNVLGLMNRDNLFWNRSARDIATLGTLSVGWNYGSARALGGGLVDMGKGIGTLVKGGKISDIDTRRISYLATTGALTALTGAAVTYMATGKPPQKLRDYIFPPNGAKDRDGHDIRINTGFYTTDYYDFMHDPVGTLKAKGSPLMHIASDIATNRDYKGDKVYDTDEPWYKQAGEVAKYLGKTAVPMSINQLHEAITGGGTGGTATKLLGFAGVKTAPRSLSMSDAENEAHKIMQGKQSVEGRSAEQSDKGTLMQRLADEQRAKNPDVQKDMQQAIKDGKLTDKDLKAITKRAHEPAGLKGLVDKLDAKDVVEKVWPKMTAQERQENQWAIRGKIGRANLPGEDKRKYWDQIKKDVVTK
jgi:hypothetical protein